MPARVLLMGIPDSGIEVLYPFMTKMPLLRKGKWLNQWEEDVRIGLNQMKPGRFRPGFIYYSETMKQFLNDQKIRRVFILRDPRDMIVSFLFSILTDPKHQHFAYFNQRFKTMEQRILRLTTGFMESRKVSKEYGHPQIGYGQINEYYSRYLRWMDDPGTLVIRYENLVNDEKTLQNEIDRLVEYLWEDLQDGGIDKKDYVKRVYKIKFWKMARSIDPGEWRKYFTDEIKNNFRNIAGELLIYLGYENDFDW